MFRVQGYGKGKVRVYIKVKQKGWFSLTLTPDLNPDPKGHEKKFKYNELVELLVDNIEVSPLS